MMTEAVSQEKAMEIVDEMVLKSLLSYTISMTVDELSKYMSFNPAYVRKSLTRLEDKGLVVKYQKHVKKKGRKRNYYKPTDRRMNPYHRLIVDHVYCKNCETSKDVKIIEFTKGWRTTTYHCCIKCAEGIKNAEGWDYKVEGDAR